MAGIGHRDPGQRIELVAPRRGKVVSKIIGKLFGKPDRVIWSHLNAHDAVVSMWRRQILESPGASIKDDQRVLAHSSKPEPPLAVDGGAHHLAIRPR